MPKFSRFLGRIIKWVKQQKLIVKKQEVWDISYQLLNSLPDCFSSEIGSLISNAPKKQWLATWYTNDCYSIIIGNEKIAIPYRQYLEEINIKELSKKFSHMRNYENLDRVEVIINCFYTRHHNGFVREASLKNIIQYNYIWVIPYIFLLIGEYVIEILDIIYKHRELMDKSLYQQFIKDNIELYGLIRQRVASYWSCYYRHIAKNKDDYVGFKILRYIQSQ